MGQKIVLISYFQYIKHAYMGGGGKKAPNCAYVIFEWYLEDCLVVTFRWQLQKTYSFQHCGPLKAQYIYIRTVSS